MMKSRSFMLLLMLVLFAGCCNAYPAKIFAYVNDDGKLVVSEKKVDSRFQLFDPFNYLVNRERQVKRRQSSVQSLAARASQYDDLIERVAQEVGVHADLLHAVIAVESSYDPMAISDKGAAGLMQLIPATAQRFGVEEVQDPESNIRGGARYLKSLLNLFDNDLTLTLAAYNAGEGAVQKYHNQIPPYPETQLYVVKVLDIFYKR